MSIKLIDVKKSFGVPPTDVLKGISLEINDGEFVSIVGRSGSGKSTLLYIMSSLDNASAGKIYYDDIDLVKMGQKEIHELRNSSIGFVFQFHYLLPELTVLENVLMPARKHNAHKKMENAALQLIKDVDLEGKENRMPSQLSGGEQQRVAIARALSNDPKIIFADEPTGNLDIDTGNKVIELLFNLIRKYNKTLIVITHDYSLAKKTDRVFRLKDGYINEISHEELHI